MKPRIPSRPATRSPSGSSCALSVLAVEDDGDVDGLVEGLGLSEGLTDGLPDGLGESDGGSSGTCSGSASRWGTATPTPTPTGREGERGLAEGELDGWAVALGVGLDVDRRFLPWPGTCALTGRRPVPDPLPDPGGPLPDPLLFPDPFPDPLPIAPAARAAAG